jgi:hypothetical protein
MSTTETADAVARADPHAPRQGIRHLGDFTTSPRVLAISAIAIAVGTAGVIAGVVLLNLIRLCTNLRISAASPWPTCRSGNRRSDSPRSRCRLPARWWWA